MKVTDILAQNKEKTLVSFEILPPLKGKSIDSITKVLDPLMEFQPPFIDVTYHREEFVPIPFSNFCPSALNVATVS